MQPELLVFGEALIDLKARSALEFQGFVGGSPLNVALAGARLGLKAALATRVSTDFFGAEITALLEHNAVNTSYLERGNEPSTLAFVNVQDGHPSYSFRFLETSTLAYSAELNVPSALRAMHYGGSLNPLFEPLSSRVLAAVQAFAGFKHFDPNVRPAILGDAVAYRARLEPWWDAATWVKLSLEDFLFLFPGESEAGFAASLLARGVSVVTVTDGGKGVRLYRTERGVLEVSAPRITVLDTVGAGDTFSGASIARLLEGNLTTSAALEAASDEALKAVLHFAATAAAINCERAGCDPPSQAEVTSRL